MSSHNQKVETSLNSEQDLRAIIPSYPKMLDKRIIPELDTYCMEIIELSRLVVFGSSSTKIEMNIYARSDIEVTNPATIKINTAIDTGWLSNEKVFASLYFLVPGVGHGLRVNGTLSGNGTAVELLIDGTYVHCARAAARSEIWNAPACLGRRKECQELSVEYFLEEGAFLLLKTMNDANRTEISPRGDEPGFVKQVGQHRLFIPERPGNKVAISLRNIIKNPVVELLLIIPSINSIMTVTGHATISKEKTFLEACSVNSKVPKVGILVESCQYRINRVDALSVAWDKHAHVDSKQLTRFSKVLSAHMNGEGFLGKASTPVIQAIVTHDMNNLY